MNAAITPMNIVKSEFASTITVCVAQYATRTGQIVTVVHAPAVHATARNTADIAENGTQWEYTVGKKVAANMFENLAHYAVKRWVFSIPSVVFPDGSVAWDPEDALEHVAAEFRSNAKSANSIAARVRVNA